MKKKHLKTIIGVIYVALIIAMGAATIIEKYRGTPFVMSSIYGSWWFSALWAMLVAFGVAYIVRCRMRRWSLILLHASFVVILLGAFLTHVTSFRGAIHLREGAPSSDYVVYPEGDGYMKTELLPYVLRLDSFEVKHHEGTSAPADYLSHLSVITAEDTLHTVVSMNNILSFRGMRYYQSSYDDDLHGSILSINSDPYGMPVTYVGYALLFLSLVMMLADKRGTFRGLLRSDAIRRGALLLCISLSPLGFPLSATTASASTTFPEHTAEHFGRMYVLYNDRVCPLQTYAYDFTKKIHGRASYRGCSPEQVLAGFIFWGDEWQKEKIIKVKSNALRKHLSLPAYVSVNELFPKGRYLLQTLIEEYYQGSNDALHKDAAKLDDKVALIVSLRQGEPLRLFPLRVGGRLQWLAPNQPCPEGVTASDSLFMQRVVNMMYANAVRGDNSMVNLSIDRVIQHQALSASTSLPSPLQVRAERLYNRIPFATILFMANLTIGFLSLFFFLWQMSRRKNQREQTSGRNISSWLFAILFSLLIVSFLSLTMALSLRWIVSGTIPMSNGYETMLSVAWFVLLLSLLTCWRVRITLTFGFILSGFFLLVSHINQMDPAIGQLMPVLNSPLLSVHVSIIMMAYAMLSLTFIIAITYFLLRVMRRGDEQFHEIRHHLSTLSLLFLYPAIVLLSAGIFVGAIWANVSWGQYWGWDPKETWALITLMVYALPLHRRSLQWLSRPSIYHLYMLLAFLTVLMTYFGVNYFLGGMHSYA